MMHRHRFYIPSEDIINNNVLIHQPEYHHIIDVLRYKEGDNIILFDGKGNEYTGRVESINRDAKSVKVFLEESSKEEITRPLVLIQSLIKSNSMDIIIQKATELGVTHIYPLITKNSVVRLEPKAQPVKINKWRRLAEEACKQCGRNWLPYIDKIWDLDEVLSALDWVETKIICTPSEKAQSLKDISGGKPGSIALMIGPEGDFTGEELVLTCSRGWVPVHLGKAILRADTAAISVMGAVCYKFGFWD